MYSTRFLYYFIVFPISSVNKLTVLHKRNKMGPGANKRKLDDSVGEAEQTPARMTTRSRSRHANNAILLDTSVEPTPSTSTATNKYFYFFSYSYSYDTIL